MTTRHSVDFFEAQFRAQARVGQFALNPFETLALPFVRGRVLDLGCGLGNLSIEAARRGCQVVALDGSPAAIAGVRERAAAERLQVESREQDLGSYRIAETFDTIVAIGLLMFLPRTRALELLDDIKAHVRPGGCVVVNVLVEGTTYLDMFEPGHYYLFAEHELEERFAGWNVLESCAHRFDAPGSTVKVFATVVATRKPGTQANPDPARCHT
jgi:tellurite methyltransferase